MKNCLSYMLMKFAEDTVMPQWNLGSVSLFHCSSEGYKLITIELLPMLA